MGFDPATMAAVGVGTSLVGSIFNAEGQEKSGEAKALEAKAKVQQLQSAAAASAYQAQVADNNAALATQDSKLITESGEVATTNEGLKTRAQVGSQKAQQGASGIDVNSGSAADVRAGTAAVGMLDALTIRSNASKAFYAKEVEANSDTAQAGLLRMESQSDLQGASLAEQGVGLAEDSGDLAATGTLLSGVSTVGTSYEKYQGLFK